MSEKEQNEPQVRYLGDVQRLALKAGDLLVLSVDTHLTDADAYRIRREMERIVGSAHRVIVLGRGMKIGAVAFPEELTA